MGQVWSKADFDGFDEAGFDGGRGSCLAVTAQYVGDDGDWFTADDIYDADLNAKPAYISFDSSGGRGVRGGGDRVRPFYGAHAGGALFVYADGSTHFVTENINRRDYINRSRRASGAVVRE